MTSKRAFIFNSPSSSNPIFYFARVLSKEITIFHQNPRTNENFWLLWSTPQDNESPRPRLKPERRIAPHKDFVWSSLAYHPSISALLKSPRISINKGRCCTEVRTTNVNFFPKLPRAAYFAQNQFEGITPVIQTWYAPRFQPSP
jgi:hypothetical protein